MSFWLRGLNWMSGLMCQHRWIRARSGDGSYGYRCLLCLRPYPRTWNDLLGQAPRMAGVVTARGAAQPLPVPAPLPFRVPERAATPNCEVIDAFADEAWTARQAAA